MILRQEDIEHTAQALVGRHGPGALDFVQERIAALNRADTLPEQAVALRILTVVERILSENGNAVRA